MPRTKISKDTCDHCAHGDTPRGVRYWLEIAGTLIAVLVVVQLWKALGLSNIIAPKTDGALGLGAVFLIGLVAATGSCLALVGGLLLSVCATWIERTQAETHWERLKPLLLFNAGRLAGYFFLGGIVGLIGSVITLKTHTTGYLTIVLSLVMIMLALQILHVIPKKYCRIPLPRALHKKMKDMSDHHHPVMPVVLGALTFFVPCGFTQSMQLLALGSGNFLQGALIMFVFALGTLPTLLGISFLGSYADGKAAKWFLTFSGCTVLLLGLSNFNSGLLLTGVDAAGWVEHAIFKTPVNEGSDPYVTIDAQGRQIISMYVTPEGYKPGNFTIQGGRDTWVYAIAKDPPQGCANFMMVPGTDASTQIKQGGNWLHLGDMKKDFLITCSMGMLKANVHIGS
jgi:sulfite exporter TauE/SafE